MDLRAVSDRTVLLVMPFFRAGGVERAWLNLAEGFLELGYEPEVLVLGELPDTRPYAVPPGVRLGALGAAGPLGAAGRLRRRLTRSRPELVVGGLTPANLTVLLATLGARPRIPCIVSVHVDIGAQEGVSGPRLAVSKLLHRYVLSLADAVVAPSEGVAAGLLRLGLPPSKVVVVPNPIVTPTLEASLRQECPHPWLAEGAPDPVIVGMGRLTDQKDFATLIRALPSVRGARRPRLVVLGEGPERPRLESLVRELGMEERVDLPGFVGNPFPYLRRAGVFCLSSRWEGFGNVLVEAMAAGTQVVSTDCPSGPREILEGGALGALVPVGDAGALAEALTEALERPTASPDLLRDRAGRYGALTAARRYLEAARAGG